MRIETERLCLRAYHTHEAETLQKLANDWEIAKWLVALPYPYTHEDAVAWIAHVQEQHTRDKPISFAFALKDTDELIGGGGLDGSHYNNSTDVALGYWLGRAYHGKGYGTEIAGALITYGFEKLGVDEIHSNANPENILSQKVMAKCGMISVGKKDVAEPQRHGGYMFVEAYYLPRREWKRNG